MSDEIVLRTDHKEVVVPITYGPVSQREYDDDGRIADCVLAGNVMIGFPVWVEILLRTDGTWSHWITAFKDKGNQYLHIEQEQNGPITEAQRRTIARWWLGLDPSPYDMPIGQTVCKWAFEGMTPKEVSAKYGDGSPVFLAGKQ